MNNGKFSYPRSSIIARYKSFAVIAFFFPSVICWCVALLGSGLPLQERAKWFFAGFLLFSVMAYIINLFPNVTVNRNKIGIQYYVFWQKWIGLDELVSISKRGWGGVGPIWIVKVQRLGLVHRLYGLYYTRTKSPTFLIGVDMLGFQELVSLIENHISAKNNSEGYVEIP